VERLSDLEVLIVDCQTTGASPALGAVLEIGWGITRPTSPEVREHQAHWIALPEGRFVSFQVRRLTGFDESHATEAIAPQDAWSRLRQSTKLAARVPTAIHFARFELAFLRDWADRFEPQTSFPLEAVCVHEIACRLYPDLPRRSIRALAGFLGYSLDPARRSMGHVEATAFIWRKLVGELAGRGVETWDQLGDWLLTPRPARSKRRRYPLPPATYRSLPDEPGIYRFVRSNGDVIYVGKAASLRKRVAGHFTAGSSTTERALEMLTQVSDVQTTRTSSALEAALLEIEEIKQRQPPYNIQLLGSHPLTWFCSSDLGSMSKEPDAIHRCGPLPSILSVRALGAIAGLLTGEAPSLSLRARAVETRERWAPEETTFADGWAKLVERHALEGVVSVASARQKLVIAARNLIAAAQSDEDAGLDDDDASDDADLWSWDADRVLRHLERAVGHAYRLLQRARWLRLLDDSAVVFREPRAELSRLLLVRGGSIAEACDLAPDQSIPDGVGFRAARERQSPFDRARYDRLRTLTTELKRVLKDGGAAAVRVGRRRWLRGARLDSLLRWV
jgi:DNA polymerase-3 subunit epsilon